MEIPTIVLPDAVQIETVEIPIPTADVPYYKPMVVPPSDLRDQEEEPVKTVEENHPNHLPLKYRLLSSQYLDLQPRLS